jgi:cobalt/nickel transport system permease protein
VPAWLHIPDGFLPLPAAAGWLAAVAGIGIGMHHTRRQMGERQVPLMGVLAAFIFAAQAVNSLVAAGTLRAFDRRSAGRTPSDPGPER